MKLRIVFAYKTVMAANLKILYLLHNTISLSNATLSFLLYHNNHKFSQSKHSK